MTLAWLLLGLVPSLEGHQSDLASLVAELGAPRYADRQRATEVLLSRGADVKPLLEAARESRDPEVRHRAEWLLDTIDCMTLVKPSPIQLDEGERPLALVLAQLGEQSGCELTIEPNRGPISTLARRPVRLAASATTTFWGALDQVRAAVGQPLTLEDRVVRRDGTALVNVVMERGRTLAVAHDGPVRAEAGEFILHREKGRMSLPIRLRAEPRLRLRVTALPRDLVALDEFGHSLVGPQDPLRDPTESGFSESDQNGGVGLMFPLLRPDGMGKTLKRLRLSVPVALAARKTEPTTVIPFADLDNKPIVVGDLTLMGRRQASFAGTGQSLILGVRGNLDPSPDLSDDQLDIVDAHGRSMVSSTSMTMWGGGMGGMGGMGRNRLGRNAISRMYQCASEEEAGTAVLRHYELRQTGTVLHLEFRDVTLPD